MQGGNSAPVPVRVRGVHCSYCVGQAANFVSAHAFVYSKVEYHGTIPLSCFLMIGTCVCGSAAHEGIQPMCTGGRQSSKHPESSSICICWIVGCPQCRCSPLTYATCRVKCIRQPSSKLNCIVNFISNVLFQDSWINVKPFRPGNPQASTMAKSVSDGE